jgi:hypothetical protein
MTQQVNLGRLTAVSEYPLPCLPSTCYAAGASAPQLPNQWSEPLVTAAAAARRGSWRTLSQAGEPALPTAGQVNPGAVTVSVPCLVAASTLEASDDYDLSCSVADDAGHSHQHSAFLRRRVRTGSRRGRSSCRTAVAVPTAVALAGRGFAQLHAVRPHRCH